MSNTNVELAARKIDLDKEHKRLKAEAEGIVRTLNLFIEALQNMGPTNHIQRHSRDHRFSGRRGPVEFPTKTSQTLADILRLSDEYSALSDDLDASLHQ